MIPTPDIIGIVKELQVWDARQFSPTESTSAEREAHWHAYDRRLQHFFPDIAQALLIAVGALEKVQQTHMKAATKPQGFTSVSSHEMCQTAGEALSLIHSLPAHE